MSAFAPAAGACHEGAEAADGTDQDAVGDDALMGAEQDDVGDDALGAEQDDEPDDAHPRVCSIRTGHIITLKGMKSVWTPETLTIHADGKDMDFVYLAKSNPYVKHMCSMEPKSRGKRKALPNQNIIDSLMLIRDAHIDKMIAIQLALHLDPLADALQMGPKKQVELKKALPEWASIQLPGMGQQLAISMAMMVPKKSGAPLCVELTAANITWICEVCQSGVTSYPLINEKATMKGTAQITKDVKHNLKGNYLYTRYVTGAAWDNQGCIHQKSVTVPPMDNASVTKMCIAQIALKLQGVHDDKHCDGVDPQSSYIWEEDSPDDLSDESFTR
jgi:hypothetical protein